MYQNKTPLIQTIPALAMLSSALSGCITPDAEFAQGDSSERSVAIDEPLPSASERRFVQNEVIVKFHDSVDPARRVAAMRIDGFHTRELRQVATGSSVWSIVPDQPLDFTSVADEEDYTLAAIEALRELPEVEYAHENARMTYYASPSDALYPQQWHYPSSKFPEAWDVTTGSLITIAVLDSGRVDHPDLAGRWTGGYNAVTGTADAYDYGIYHHGLHVAGVLGARTNNGTGVAASCWNCRLMPIRISANDGDPTFEAVSNGIVHAADNGARVINMSFGTFAQEVKPCSMYKDIQTAVTYARNKGVVVVAAAGNDAGDTANVTPASCSGVIAVGASGKNGKQASWSNKGARVDIVAPGGDLNNLAEFWARFFGNLIGCPVDPGWPGTGTGTGGVVSTWAISKPANALVASDYCYRYLAGTSLSAPHVAGLAALLLSQRPQLTPAQVTARIKGAATVIPGCGVPQGCGAGLLNAAAAVFPPLPERGMWFNPARNGNGMEIHPRPAEDKISFRWLTYTATEQPIWYHAELSPGLGAWEGTLLKSTWNGSNAAAQSVGTAKLRRTNGQWRYEWTLAGASGNEPIQKLSFGAGQRTMDLGGLWQHALQPGWSVEFESSGTTTVSNLMVFASNGEPTWLQGVVNTTSTKLYFPMLYVKGKNLCPGCVGTPSTSFTPAGTLTVQGATGTPNSLTASMNVNWLGGAWYRSPITMSRMTGP